MSDPVTEAAAHHREQARAIERVQTALLDAQDRVIELAVENTQLNQVCVQQRCELEMLSEWVRDQGGDPEQIAGRKGAR